MSNSAERLQEILNGIERCIEEYGLKVSERKSKVVCVNGESQSREWKCGMIKIQEVKQYTYMGVTVIGIGEEWKGIVVNKRMYGCGALVWCQLKCADLEVKQNDNIGRWLWKELEVKLGGVLLKRGRRKQCLTG